MRFLLQVTFHWSLEETSLECSWTKAEGFAGELDNKNVIGSRILMSSNRHFFSFVLEIDDVH